MHVHHVRHSSRALGTVLSLQTRLSLTRNINVKVAGIELYYIFSKISKFRYSNTGNFFTDFEYIYLPIVLIRNIIATTFIAVMLPLIFTVENDRIIHHIRV